MSSDPFADANRDAGLSFQSQLTSFVLTPQISDKSAGVFIVKADRKQAKTAVRYGDRSLSEQRNAETSADSELHDTLKTK